VAYIVGIHSESPPLRRLVSLVGLSILICGGPAGAIAAPSISISSIVRLQPGWVRVYLQVGDPPINAQFKASAVCAAPTSASSIITGPSNGNSPAVDIKVDPNWLANNGLPAPCHLTQLNVTMTGAALTAEATANVDVAMDLPLSLLTPDNTPIAPTNTQIQLTASSGYAAYPPLMVLIRSQDGHAAFVEVEQLPGRGTVGVRGVSTFFGKTNGKWNLVTELGGGGEIFDGWGLDVVDQGIWRAPQSAQEIKNPGHDKFSYTGTVEPPILATPVQKVFPAPPLFTTADYNANVLNNRGVVRCFDTYQGKSTGCMQITYDQKQNVLNAVNGAQIALLTPAPVTLGTQVSTTPGLPVQVGIQATPRPPGSGATVKLDDPAVAAKLVAAAQAMAAARDLTKLASMPVAMRSSRASTGTRAKSRDYKSVPISPQEAGIENGAANQVINLGATTGSHISCVIAGGQQGPVGPGHPNPRPVPYHVTATPSKCLGMHGPVFACPTTGDAIDVETLGTGNTSAMALTATIPPYYAGRDNRYGTCVSHAVTQYLESLFDRYTDDLAGKRTIYVNGDPVVVPMPRVALSVSGGTAQDFDWDSTRTGDPPAPNLLDYSANSNGAPTLPNFPEAYWMARESAWNAWVNAAQNTAGNAQLCQTCANNKCTNAYWPSAYCMGQGHPGPGVYFSHSQQAQTLQDDPLSDPPWSLANHWFNYIEADIPLDNRDQAIQSVIKEIQGGLPVNLDFDVVRAKETPDGSGQPGAYLDVGDTVMTWYLPPELAGCSKEQLDEVLGRKGGHSVDIIGYWITGTLAAPDPVQSYFILENNWGKDAGYHSFYFMNFAAFKYLAYGLKTWRLDWTCFSVACAHQPRISALPRDAILQLEYPPNPADTVATANYKEVLEQARAVLSGVK